MLWKAVVTCALSILLRVETFAQNNAPASGEVTVRTSGVVDSAALRVGQPVQGIVQSNSPEVPRGSTAFMVLLSDPSGMTLRLVRIQANGQLLNASSSSVKLAPGLFNKVNNARRAPGEPPVTVTGPHLYLHMNTDLVFTLAPAPEMPAPQQRPQRVVRQAPPPRPSHPANTARDLPPAALGYPPIHASHDAQENCWWTPFVSAKFQLEAAVQTCADQKMNSLVLEMEDGLGLQYQGSTPVNPPERFVRVVTKPADQAIELAIKQQFISKLKVPAARTACKPLKGSSPNDPNKSGVSANNPDLLSYYVAATGPYSKLKKFQGEDAESACEALEMSDAISAFFLYNPTESKTKFLFFQEDDNGSVFDQDSVHFMPQQ